MPLLLCGVSQYDYVALGTFLLFVVGFEIVRRGCTLYYKSGFVCKIKIGVLG